MREPVARASPSSSAYLLTQAFDSIEDEGPYASRLTARERIAALA